MTNGGDLPKEMMIEIFSRLPVKSLIRFNCVCKSWRALFESRTFMTKHLNSDKRDASMILRYHSDRKYSYSLLPYETLDVIENIDFRSSCTIENIDDHELHYPDIVASCDGIICLDECGLNEIFLWNPATRQFRKLMPSPRPFHNRDDRYSHGFGYDVKGNDYKVIQLPDKKTFPYRAHIYKLSSNSWSICDAIVPTAFYDRNYVHRVYINGIYSWFAADMDSHNRLIVSFDMSKEVFITTELPDKFKESSCGESLIALNKCLVMFIFSIIPYGYDVGECEGEILQLNEYGVKESWTKLYTVGSSVSELYRSIRCSKNGDRNITVTTWEGEVIDYTYWYGATFDQYYSAMTFWKNGDILVRCQGEVVVLRPKTQQTKVLQLDSFNVALPRIWFYNESLLPII